MQKVSLTLVAVNTLVQNLCTVWEMDDFYSTMSCPRALGTASSIPFQWEICRMLQQSLN